MSHMLMKGKTKTHEFFAICPRCTHILFEMLESTTYVVQNCSLVSLVITNFEDKQS